MELITPDAESRTHNVLSMLYFAKKMFNQKRFFKVFIDLSPGVAFRPWLWSQDPLTTVSFEQME